MESKKNKRSAFVDADSTKFKQFTVVNGDEAVRYFEAGEGVIPLIIFYTGGIWRSPAAHEFIAESRKVIRLVVPGFVHDYGEHPQSVDSFEEVMMTLKMTIDNLGIKQFDLMGSSLAAGFATGFTLQYPEYVKSLILVSPEVLIPIHSKPGQKKVDSPEDLRERFLSKDADVEVPAVLQVNLDTLESRVERLFPSSIRISLESRLTSLHIPILIVYGTDDRLLASKESSRYQALLPEAKMTYIDGAGYVPEVEQPKAFSKIVEDFLT